MFNLCYHGAGVLCQSTSFQVVHNGKKKNRCWIEVQVCYTLGGKKKEGNNNSKQLKRFLTKENWQDESLQHSIRGKAMQMRAELFGDKIEEDSDWLKKFS